MPSENLSRPLYLSVFGYNYYLDAATVQLDQTDTTSLSFTTSDYCITLKMHLDTKFGVTGKWEERLLFTVVGWDMFFAGGKFKAALRHKVRPRRGRGRPIRCQYSSLLG